MRLLHTGFWLVVAVNLIAVGAIWAALVGAWFIGMIALPGGEAIWAAALWQMKLFVLLPLLLMALGVWLFVDELKSETRASRRHR